MSKLYALLVGIDKYANIRPLSGCETDVVSMNNFLSKQASGVQEYIPRLLKTESATKSAIVQAFEDHLVNIDTSQGDVLLFYFSGHGAEEDAHEVFWHSEPNHKLQVLACYDSNCDTGKNFLADKELRYLIHRAAKPGVEIVTIFDCCHSGDNTRSGASGGSRERLAGQVPQRPWEDFIFGQTVTPDAIAMKGLKAALPQGKHIQLAACDSYESAWERDNTGGFFTMALLEVLNKNAGDISYLELKSKVKNAVRSQHTQTPQIYAYVGHGENAPSEINRSYRDVNVLSYNDDFRKALFKTFLGGAIKDKPIGSEVYFNNNEKRWEVDKGAIYGVSEIWKGEPQQIVVNIGDDETAFATIQKAYPGFSVIEFEPYPDIIEEERYGAFVPSLLSSRLQLSTQGDSEGMAIFKKAVPDDLLTKYGLEIVDKDQGPEFNLLAIDNHYRITLPGDTRPLSKDISGYDDNGIQELLNSLKKIKQWSFLINLKNEIPATRLSLNALEISVYWDDQLLVPDEEGYACNPTKKDSKGNPVGVLKLSIINRSGIQLFTGAVYASALFDLSARSIAVRPLEQDRSLEKSFEFSMEPFIPEFNWEAETIYLQLIAAASEFELDLFEQKGVPPPTRGEPTKGAGRQAIPPDPAIWGTWLLPIRLINPSYKP